MDPKKMYKAINKAKENTIMGEIKSMKRSIVSLEQKTIKNRKTIIIFLKMKKNQVMENKKKNIKQIIRKKENDDEDMVIEDSENVSGTNENIFSPNDNTNARDNIMNDPLGYYSQAHHVANPFSSQIVQKDPNNTFLKLSFREC